MATSASDLEAEVTFLSGVTAQKTLTDRSYWTWDKADKTGISYLEQSKAHKWQGGEAGTSGGTVRYAFDGDSNWSAGEKASFLGGIAFWSSIANIKFEAATDQDHARLVFTRGSDDDGATTYVNETGRNIGSKQLSSMHTDEGPVEIVINTSKFGWQQLDSFDSDGGYGVATVVHELGHAIGLGHAGPYNASIKGGLSIEEAQFGKYDSTVWSIMSYIKPEDKGAAYYSEYTVKVDRGHIPGTDHGYVMTTPGMADIIAAQRLYGVSLDSGLSGNQTFGFNTTIAGALKPYFDFNQNQHPVVTLFSTGSNNTLDLSGFSEASTVDLNPGTFSSVHGMVNNISIALGVRIDNAVGGSGNDRFTLSATANRIDGGDGVDTVKLGQALHAVTATLHANEFLLTSGGFTDTLQNVEKLQFTDGTLVLGQDPGVSDVFYAQQNPDVFRAGIAADVHYNRSGWMEGRDPNAWFSTKAYLSNHADVMADGINPLTEYDTTGWKLGYDPSAKFSTSLYLKLNPDVAAAGVSPLLHFLTHGEAEGRTAIAVVDSAHLAGDRGSFDATYYKLANPDIASSGIDPYGHWQGFGQKEGRDPNAFFDTDYYLLHNPDVASAGIDALAHYLDLGWKEGRNPSSHFDTSAYLSHYQDVAAAGIDPLLHFLQSGIGEGRSAYGDGL